MTLLKDFKDDFPGTKLDQAKWTHPGLAGDPVQPIVSSNKVAIPPDMFVETTATYDLTDNHIQAKVDVSPNLLIFFSVISLNGVMSLVYRNGFVQATLSNTSEEKSIKYDPLLHAFWRIREGDGYGFWELSPDGLEWEELMVHEHFMNVTSVYFYFGTTGYVTSVAPPPQTSYGTRLYGEGPYGAGAAFGV